MLKVSYIIDNKDEVIKALLKRNFDANKIALKFKEIYNASLN